ncbi:MAG: N-acetylmuramoyl-L-alanine amidase [Candidatus Eisenbacteria bacterium]|nr:N-acetylmuramoyl-L-alanine amidase [Candidatus Eisenbacteria bacterium]
MKQHERPCRHSRPASAACGPRADGTIRALAAIVAFVALAVCGASSIAGVPRVPERPQGPDSAPVQRIDGERVIGANDLARLLDATKFWRNDVRKLELRVRAHRVLLTADNPYVIVDESTVLLTSPVRSRGGELQAPIALLDSLPRDSSVNRLVFDPRADRVVVVPAGGVVGSPRVVVAEGVTRIVFPVDHPEDAVVVSRSRAHLRVRLPGYFAGVLPDSGRQGLMRSMRTLPAVSGCALEMSLASDALGFRLLRESEGRRVTLEICRAGGPAWETFAPEGPPGPRALRVVVLDPGHGGDDPGVNLAGAVEKDLALDLARRLRGEIESRIHARVVLTRDEDRRLDAQQRAEAANRAHADLVISLHFDGLPGSRSSGASAYCPPADVSATAGLLGGVGPNAIAVLPWRDVAARHAVESRALAEAVLGSLELRGLGPTRLRERLPCPLLGVHAPGLLLECATLTSPEDRARVSTPEGLDALARAITDGIEAYRRNE